MAINRYSDMQSAFSTRVVCIIGRNVFGSSALYDRDERRNALHNCARNENAKINDADEFYANFTENKLHFRRSGLGSRKCE